jgi:predicted lipid-binding transport protein (Tim44 family)
MRYQTRIPAGVVPQTWWGRLAATLLAVSLAVIGLFFLVFALIAAMLIGALVIARIWWLSRKLRAQRDATVIEGAYSVEVEPTRTLPAENAESVTRPPDSR